MSARTARPDAAPGRLFGRFLALLTAATIAGGVTGCAAVTPRPETVIPKEAPQFAPGIPAEAQQLTVRYVHDGDTLFVNDGAGMERKVRLIGVDTPELLPEPECFADNATNRLRELLPEGSTVWAASDVEPFDRYGRALLYMWTREGVFVNLTLVSEGYAEAIRVGENDAWWPELRAAEAAAQNASEGRWGACGL